MSDPAEQKAVAETVSSYYWWHSIDLGNGIVTNGIKTLDMMHAQCEKTFGTLDLSGRTVLDVGTWNGGFALEASRRGAKSVTGLDHYVWNHPRYRAKETFRLVSTVTGTPLGEIDRDLDTPRLDLRDLGTYDVVLFLGVFYHLRNPLSALQEISALVDDVLVVETHIEKFPDDRPAMVFYPGSELGGDESNWWAPNRACMIALLKLMGFARVQVDPGFSSLREIFHAYR